MKGRFNLLQIAIKQTRMKNPSKMPSRSTYIRVGIRNVDIEIKSGLQPEDFFSLHLPTGKYIVRYTTASPERPISLHVAISSSIVSF